MPSRYSWEAPSGTAPLLLGSLEFPPNTRWSKSSDKHWDTAHAHACEAYHQ